MKTKYDKAEKGIECPRCRRNTFLNQVNTKTGNPLFYQVIGKCNNKKCEYVMTPKQFNAQIFRDFTMEEHLWSYAELQIKAKFIKKENTISEDDKDYKNNGLAQFLCSKFDKKTVYRVLSKYYVCTSEFAIDPITKYWYLDKGKNACFTRLVSYDPTTGQINSGSELSRLSPLILKVSNANPYGEIIKNDIPITCLFGLHLTPDIFINQICIVENEKAAIIGSIVFPDKTWMATGGQELSFPLINPIIGNDVVLFPSDNQYYEWKRFAEKYDLKLSTMLKSNFNLPDTDLSDYILSKCDTWHE